MNRTIQCVMAHKSTDVSVCNREGMFFPCKKFAALQQIAKELASILAMCQISNIFSMHQVRGKIVKKQIRSLQTKCMRCDRVGSYCAWMWRSDVCMRLRQTDSGW